MIAYLQWIVIERNGDLWTIAPESMWIGYEVFVPGALFSSSSDTTSMVIYHHITEQSQKLFWFPTSAEKIFFQKLISVSGLGPKWGIGMMNLGIDTIQKAIVTEDEKTLTSVSGIWPKLAKKIILDLKGSINLSDIGTWANVSKTSTHEDVAIALTGMGYDKKSVKTILDTYKWEDTSTQIVLQYALKELAQG